MQVELRPYNPETDRSFVYSTWLRGLYYGNSYFNSIDKEVFFEQYERVVDHILANSEIIIAGLTDDGDTILGYAVLSGPVAHWVHVKSPWRKKGIAKLMVAGRLLETVTHITPAGNAIRNKLKLKHNPWRIT